MSAIKMGEGHSHIEVSGGMLHSEGSGKEHITSELFRTLHGFPEARGDAATPRRRHIMTTRMVSSFSVRSSWTLQTVTMETGIGQADPWPWSHSRNNLRFRTADPIAGDIGVGAHLSTVEAMYRRGARTCAPRRGGPDIMARCSRARQRPPRPRPGRIALIW